jgi:hypothetical protein
LISDSQITLEQKAHITSDLQDLGIFLPEWLAYGMTTAEFGSFCRAAAKAKQRYNTELIGMTRSASGAKNRQLHGADRPGRREAGRTGAQSQAQA